MFLVLWLVSFQREGEGGKRRGREGREGDVGEGCVKERWMGRWKSEFERGKEEKKRNKLGGSEDVMMDG